MTGSFKAFTNHAGGESSTGSHDSTSYGGNSYSTSRVISTVRLAGSLHQRRSKQESHNRSLAALVPFPGREFGLLTF